MSKAVGLVWVVVFFGLVAGRTRKPHRLRQRERPSTALTRWFPRRKSTKLTRRGTDSWANAHTGNRGRCTLRTVKARYTTATGDKLRGTVGPQGQLAMRILTPTNSSNAGSRPVEVNLNGSVDANGTVHARQIGNSCSYDYVWQKRVEIGLGEC